MSYVEKYFEKKRNRQSQSATLFNDPGLYVVEYNENGDQWHVQPLYDAIVTNTNHFLNGQLRRTGAWVILCVTDSRTKAHAMANELQKMKATQ